MMETVQAMRTSFAYHDSTTTTNPCTLSHVRRLEEHKPFSIQQPSRYGPLSVEGKFLSMLVCELQLEAVGVVMIPGKYISKL